MACGAGGDDASVAQAAEQVKEFELGELRAQFGLGARYQSGSSPPGGALVRSAATAS